MDWSGFGIKTRMFLLNIIVQINKPIVFSAGGITPLSLESFTKVELLNVMIF